jgi:methylthioribose-1-phosphate isomerase
VAPEGAGARNLAFDVTPYELVMGIVTEEGLVEPPFLPNVDMPHRGRS